MCDSPARPTSLAHLTIESPILWGGIGVGLAARYSSALFWDFFGVGVMVILGRASRSTETYVHMYQIVTIDRP